MPEFLLLDSQPSNKTSATTGLAHGKPIVSLLKKNVLSLSLAAIIVIQLPFTCLYFRAKPQVVVQERSHKVEKKPIEEAKSLPPAFEARKDPFALLPGMEKKDLAIDQTLRDDTNNSSVFTAFRGQNKPDVNNTTTTESSENTHLAIRPLPVSIPPKQNLSASTAESSKPVVWQPAHNKIKLIGTIRYNGKAMAIIESPDKTTAQTAEGDRVSGTNCYVVAVRSTKVLISQAIEDSKAETWLCVGEEWQF